MSVQIEQVAKNKIKMSFELDADAFEEGLNRSFRKNAKRFNIPGFRKGRAPRHMVERYYGVEVLYEDAVEILCPENYIKAVEENNIEPVDRPDFDIAEFKRGEPFKFTATVVVKPEVVLGQYSGLEAEYENVIVTDDDVMNEIKKTAEKSARLIPVEDRPAQEGDVLLIDYSGSIDGVAFEGGERKNYNLELGSRSFIPGFEDQLIGKNAGDETTVKVRFPDEYGSSGLAGKDAEFAVKIHTIKIKEVPEIDDEFAQDASEFESLEEFKADIRKKMTEHLEARAQKKFQDAVVDKAVENAEMDIPEAMIVKQIEYDVKEFEMYLIYQGITPESYYESQGMTREQVAENMRERAVAEVRTQLVFQKIAKEESIEVSDDDYLEELKKRAESQNKDIEEYKKSVTDDLENYIKSNIKANKVQAFITANAKRV